MFRYHGSGRISRSWLSIGLAVAVIGMYAGSAGANVTGLLNGVTPVAHAQIPSALANPPVMFVRNVGQFAGQVLYQANTNHGTLWMAQDSLWLTVIAPSKPAPLGSTSITARFHNPKLERITGADGTPTQVINGVNLQLRFLGANAHPQVAPFASVQTKVSYFQGSDPKNWRADAPAYGGIRYVNLYPNVDLELSGFTGALQGRLVARQGARLDTIRLQVLGAQSIVAGPSGFQLKTEAGDVTFPLLSLTPLYGHILPGQYAPSAVTGNVISAPYVLHVDSASAPASGGGGGKPSHSTLLYGSYLGGSGADRGESIAADASGNAYVTGWTNSVNFPVRAGAFQQSCTCVYGGDAFVASFNSTGTKLNYATYLGGTAWQAGLGIAVDAAGNAYITGFTGSRDFPTTRGSFQRTNGGGGDAFLTKLNPTGTALVYSGFIGGESDDEGNGVAVDAQGNAYVTGYTTSIYFPVTAHAYQKIFGGPCNYNRCQPDGFVAKVNAAGTKLMYATYLGGTSYDNATGIAVDGAGHAYVTGLTGSTDFPVTLHAFQTQCLSCDNGYGAAAFVTELNATGTNAVYSTYLSGGQPSFGTGVAVDVAGEAFVTGGTYAGDFPVTPGSFNVPASCYYYCPGAFVTKFTPDGSKLVYSGLLRGSNYQEGDAIAVDALGNAYVAGGTNSADFPTTVGAAQPQCSTYSYYGQCWQPDAYVSVVNGAGDQLVYSTFLGGSDFDVAYGVATDGQGNAYVTGDTYSYNFPTTRVAFQPFLNGYEDAFVAKLAVDTCACYYFPSYDDTTATDLLLVANPGSVPAPVSVTLAGKVIDSFVLAANQEVSKAYAGKKGGLLVVRSTADLPLITGQRMQSAKGFDEQIGHLASTFASSEFFLGPTSTTQGTHQLLLGDPNAWPIHATVYVGNQPIATEEVNPQSVKFFTLPAKARGIINVVGQAVASSEFQRVVASEQTIWNAQTTNTWGVTSPRIASDELFVSYEGYNSDANDVTLTGNPNNFWLPVGFTIGGALVASDELYPDQVIQHNYGSNHNGISEAATGMGGVLVEQRVRWRNASYEDILGAGRGALGSSNWYPYYDATATGNQDWLVVANPGASPIYANVTIAGKKLASNVLIAPGSQVQLSYANVTGGLVHIFATDRTGTPATILTEQRAVYNQNTVFHVTEPVIE